MIYNYPSPTRPAPSPANGIKMDLSPGAHRVTLRLVDATISLTDNAGVVAYGSLKLLDFPAGLIRIHGCTANLVLTKSSAGVNADWDGDIAIGTVAANNGATLATTEQNVCPTTATPQAVGGVTTGDLKSTATEAVLAIDGTGTAGALYLNVLIDDADHDVTGTACNIIANGTITIVYSDCGDV